MMKTTGRSFDPAVAKATAEEMAKLNGLPPPQHMTDTVYAEPKLSRCYLVYDEETRADVIYENDGNTIHHVISFVGRFQPVKENT